MKIRVIDPNTRGSMTARIGTAALKLAEALVSLRLHTSKRGDYAPPLVKTCTGLAAPYSPRGAT